MKRLRSHFWVLLVFGLISLGQAYPYSVAWALGRSVEQCSCNRAKRSCIHGCALKKKAPADPHAHHGHGAKSSQASVQDEDGAPGGFWVSPNCSTKKTRAVLSFQSEPCLMPQRLESYAFLRTEFLETVFPQVASWKHSLEPPPPKFFS